MAAAAYLRGFAGMEAWISDLQTAQRFDPEDVEGVRVHANINNFIYGALLEARDAGVHFLRRMPISSTATRAAISCRLVERYAQVVNTLQQGKPHIPNPDELDPHTWTPEMREAQCTTLRRVIALERQAITPRMRCWRILSRTAPGKAVGAV